MLKIKQQTFRSPYPIQKVHQEVPPARVETCRNDCDPVVPLARINTTVLQYNRLIIKISKQHKHRQLWQNVILNKKHSSTEEQYASPLS